MIRILKPAASPSIEDEMWRLSMSIRPLLSLADLGSCSSKEDGEHTILHDEYGTGSLLSGFVDTMLRSTSCDREWLFW